MYRTRAIITRSRFETALDYKPRIFKVRKVSLYYKPLCNINRGLYNYQKLKNSNSNVASKVFSYICSNSSSIRNISFEDFIANIAMDIPSYISLNHL